MKTHFQKHQIVESLKSLDNTQTEKVLDYIKGLTKIPDDQVRYEASKREAMMQIRAALKKGRLQHRMF